MKSQLSLKNTEIQVTKKFLIITSAGIGAAKINFKKAGKAMLAQLN